MKTRVAVVGVGYLGRFHAEKYAAEPDVELVAVVDPDTQRAAEIATRLGCRSFADVEAIRAVRDATTRRVTAAGGITTQQEIDALDAMGVDAVVGMAIYTGALDPDAPPERLPQ